ARVALSRHCATGEERVWRADIRLPGERRVRDDQGGRRARLAGRAKRCAGIPPVDPQSRRGCDPELLLDPRGALASGLRWILNLFLNVSIATASWVTRCHTAGRR